MTTTPVNLWRREKLLILTWETLGLCLDDIRMQIDRSGFAPTTIVGISRGGLVLATYLANMFALRDLQAISIIRNTSEGRYSERGEPVLAWMAPDTGLEGKRVLVADDIVGDGGTLRFVLSLLEARGASAVRTAVVVKNVNSPVIPDYQAVESSDWVVFPWEPAAEPTAKSELLLPGVSAR